MILLPKESWEIKTAKEKGRGLFAKKDIRAGIVIGDYLGKVIRTATDDTVEKDEGLFLMYYHDNASIYPTDVKSFGMHVINHSCTPNCWMYVYKGHTLFFTLRYILKGEELTVSYLLSPKTDLCNPCKHTCRCGSEKCSGSMHMESKLYKKWRKFSENEAKKTKRERIRYGKELKPLNVYPKRMPDKKMVVFLKKYFLS